MLLVKSVMMEIFHHFQIVKVIALGQLLVTLVMVEVSQLLELAQQFVGMDLSSELNNATIII